MAADSAPPTPRHTVALVLGAGGAPGWAWLVGVLAAIEEVTGWDPRRADLVIGTSAGSGVAATLRAGLAASDQLRQYRGDELSDEGAALMAAADDRRERLAEADANRQALSDAMAGPRDTAEDARPGDRRPASPAMALRSALLRPGRPGLAMSGLVPRGRRDLHDLGRRLDSLHQDGWPRRPLWVTAVRIGDAARVVFGRDGHPPLSVGTAVQASCAQPGVFRPVALAGGEFVDGGTWSVTNADLAAGLGFETVLVLAPLSAETGASGRSPAMIRRTYHRGVLARELDALRRNGSDVLSIEPSPADLAVLTHRRVDERRRREAAERGRATAVARLVGDSELAEAIARFDPTPSG
ncbi:MAG: patatin-like phospholipase family protein [Acidimicrobiia bacterium]|nr:patatin-like phospholipase family protein [Acidimicrobiia bacterium]